MKSTILTCLILILLGTVFVTFVRLSGPEMASKGESLPTEARDAARFRPRRLIFNNDGDDAVLSVRKPNPTPRDLLAVRTLPLKGTHVDSMVYCTTRGTFDLFTHQTRIGKMDFRQEGGSRHFSNVFPPFLEQGTDPLNVMIDYSRENGTEIWWGMRMNDTHDASNPLIVSRFKEEHPELLFGTVAEPPPRGLWSAVDYGRREVRDFAFRIIAEVIDQYDIDGVQLDFWRHPMLFRKSGWNQPLLQEDLDLMTELISRVRAKLDEKSRERGRYLLLGIKVPDSVDYCRAIGIDLERWMKENFVDLVMFGGYFQLNPWKESVALAKRYQIPVYACLAENRVRDPIAKKERASIEALRARALAAWAAGVDGIEMFNHFNTSSPLWSELGDPALLRLLPKTYFASVQGGTYMGFRSFVPSRPFLNASTINPSEPEPVSVGESRSYLMEIGDDLTTETGLKGTLWVKLERIPDGNTCQIRWNDSIIPMTPSGDRWLVGHLDPAMVTPGTHTVTVAADRAEALVVEDVAVKIEKISHQTP